MIGLVGAQRVGKTTLACKFAQEQRMHFVETRTSQVMAEMGLDPRITYPLDVRLQAQNRILDALEEQYVAATAEHRYWITDRTPIDTATYMLADVTRDMPIGMSDGICSYVQRCIDVANRHFAVLVLVQPGIAPVDEQGKALAIPAFQEHFNSLAFGLLMDERLLQRHYFIRRSFVSMPDRMASLFAAVAGSLESWKQTLAASEMVAH